MNSSNPFKWRHYQPEIILLGVRWYLGYTLSYRDLEEIMLESGLQIDHSTLNRWVLQYSPELDKWIRRHLKSAKGSYHIDETYIKVKRKWMFLYRAVDPKGQTIDFMLSGKRDRHAAKRFFHKTKLKSVVSGKSLAKYEMAFTPVFRISKQTLKEKYKTEHWMK